MQFKKLIATLFIIFFISACSTTSTDPTDAFKGQTAKQIFLTGEQMLAKGDYDKAVKAFEALDALYPFDENAKQGQFNIIYAYYMTGDTASTTASAERFMRLYPRDPHVDYAYYMKALSDFNEYRGFLTRYIHFDMSQRDVATAKKAYKDFDDLVSTFPDSSYAPDARQHMVYLRNTLAQHDLLVAKFYMKRTAYVAAANRASLVIRNYPTSSAAPEALAIMVQAYRALNLAGPANDALKVLQANYPKSKELMMVR